MSDGQLHFLLWSLNASLFFVTLYLYWVGGDDKYLVTWQRKQHKRTLLQQLERDFAAAQVASERRITQMRAWR